MNAPHWRPRERADRDDVALHWRMNQQRPADVAQLAASLLRPRSPWKRAHGNPGLRLKHTWRDASMNGAVVERHVRSAISNTGRCENAARLASTEAYPD